MFSSDKIEYDFKEKKGFLLKVKGLVRTKNLSKNLDLICEWLNIGKT